MSMRSTLTIFAVAIAALAGGVNAQSHVLTVFTPVLDGAGRVTSVPAGIDCPGQCQFAFPAGMAVDLTAIPNSGSAFAGWTAPGCAGAATCRQVSDRQREVSAKFVALQGAPTPFIHFQVRPFSETSLHTTSTELVTLVNAGAGSFTVTSITSSNPQFVARTDCGAMASAAICDIAVDFTPTTSDGAISGVLTISTTAGSISAFPSGQGTRSLIPHYYQSILRREPDLAGGSFWASEAARVSLFGYDGREVWIPITDQNETWFAMAQSFYASPEYDSFNRANGAFVADLYDTFFNRAPDAAGFAYWVGQLDAGLPREVALTAFLFSIEFANLSRMIFGDTDARAEIDVVMDFYRGMLGRLPDNTGFAYWLGRFRAAQCQGAAAVNAEVEAVSSAFALSAEYAARNRGNGQYVADLYNAFLRRGGDFAGVQFWTAQLDSGQRTREQLRVEFKNSPEFQGRVGAIIALGCSS